MHTTTTSSTTMPDSSSQKRRLVACDAAPVSKKRKRNVSFAATVISHDSHHRDGATCGESWITKDDIMTMVRAHPAAVQQIQAADPHAYHMHCELLATTYTNSVLEGDSIDNSSTPAASLSYSHLLGMSSSLELRGLEAFVLSSVASDRMQRRRRHQSTMLRAQVKLGKTNSDDERASLMRQLSERLSASSQAFARAMGAADTCAAMMEHASSLALPTMMTSPTSNSHHSFATTAAVLTPPPTTKAALVTGLTETRRSVPCKVVSPMA